MSVRISSQARNKLPYLLVTILLSLGYFNYIVISEPIIYFFRISSLTGQVLVNKFLSICNCTFEIVKLTYSFFQILYEDSLIFLKDATEKFTFAIYLLKELYLFLEDFGWNFLNILFQLAETLFSFFGFVHGIIETVKKGLYLTGSAIWRTFVNIPEAVVSNINGINEFVKHTFNEIINCILTVKEKIISGLENVYLLLFDVPLDSVYGLIIGALILIVLCIKFKDICCIISCAFCKIHQQTVSLGITLWSGRFLEHKAASHTDYSIEDDERLCIICQYQLKEIIIFPCKHLCLCRECSKQLEKNHPICPICREIWRIFLLFAFNLCLFRNWF